MAASSSSSIISTKNQRHKKPKNKHKQHCCNNKNDENDDYYPDVLSLTTTTTTTTASSLTYDFVIRSLRRRLWKAFCEDDCISALRAYQATLSDFRCWLEEEEELRRQHQREAVSSSTTTADSNPFNNDHYMKKLKIRSGSFGILMAFHHSQSSVLKMNTICEEAQRFCDDQMDSNFHHKGRMYGAWASMKTLTSHHLVSDSGSPLGYLSGRGMRDHPHDFSLTKEGELFIKALLTNRPEAAAAAGQVIGLGSRPSAVDAVAAAAKEENEKHNTKGQRTSLSCLFSSSSRRLSSKLLDSNNDNNDNGNTNNSNDKKKKKDRKSKKLSMVETDDDDDDYELALQRQRRQQEDELEQQTESVNNIKSIEKLLGGSNVPILQSQMNPSEFFIADDYLSPYDYCTYEERRKKQRILPTAEQQHQQYLLLEEEERQKRRIRQLRLSSKPRVVAFRRLFSSSSRSSTATATAHRQNNVEDNDSDFGLVNSLVTDALNEHDNNNNNNGEVVTTTAANTISPSSSTESNNNENNNNNSNANANTNDNDNTNDNVYMTTPLHEAARLGFGDFVRVLLANNNAGGADVNEKNGYIRTAIHMCAGGVTIEEERLINAQQIIAQTQMTTIGIRSTVIPKDLLELLRQDPATATTTTTKKSNNNRSSKGSMTKRRSLIERVLFNRNRKKNDSTTEDTDGSNHRTASSSSSRDIKIRIKPDSKRLNELVTSRMDAMMALLSWIQKDSCQGPSINAVDNNGRTALHYAAELGRTDICMAILSNFGVILTVVDESSRTPCEVAALQGHSSLAAQLEARALLYVDPYGLDDMMDNMMAVSPLSSSGNSGGNNNNKKLVPPFRWFQTMSMDEVSQSRMTWLLEIRRKLIHISNDSDDNNNISMEDKKPSSVPNLKNRPSYTTWSDNLNLQPYIGASFKSDTNATDYEHRHSETELCRHDIIPPAAADLERYLAYHNWERSAAIDAFRKDPKRALATAGVKFIKRGNGNNNIVKANDADEEESRLCTICYDDDVDKENWMQFHSSCNHGFCKDCLLDYVKQCAVNRTPMHSITCPSHDCDQGLSFLDVQSLLLEKDHTDTFERIKEASTESFITSSSNYKYCPHPGCEGVVHRLDQPEWTNAGFDKTFLDYTGAVCTIITDRAKIGDDCTLTYEGVEDLDYNNCRSTRQPPKAHRFCFSCLEPVHWPLKCERMKEWKEKITEEIGEIDTPNGDFNELAQNMWLKANTRPCPHCKAPIEKNDGCNHVVCKSCSFEFCWVCMKAWYLHTIETSDGYFRCSIWEKDDSGKERDNHTDSLNGTEGYGTSIYTARQAWRKKQEMKRFLHHYSKYSAHEESSILERKMGDSVCTRLAPVVEAAIDFDGSPLFNFGGNGLSFVHNAFLELLECRSILGHSYAFSYFRYPPSSSNELPPVGYLHNSKRKEKARFERTQSELEMLTEQMSDIVGRSHIRATQVQVAYLTAGAAAKRVDFTNFMFQIYREEKKEIDKQKKRQAREEEGKKNHVSSSLELSNDSPGQEEGSQTETFIAAMDNVRALRREHDNILNAFRRISSERMLRTNQGMLGAEEITGILDGGGDDNDDDDEYYDANEPAQMWACSRCTFMNTEGNRCSMCASLR